ncbi:MAG: hypothetical protein K2K25_07570 [Muribaculaceae bacterium]|nr:hypothetical protein [Muribaculaceae bacterium]
MKRNIAEIILTAFLILIVIVAIGFSMGMHSLTIIEWWKPVIACGVIALPVTFLIAKYMKRLTCTIFDYLEYPAAFILSFSIILAAFYASNYFLSDDSSSYEYHAPVVRKYSQVRTRSFKTGRRGYRNEKYKVYIIELEMKDGKIKRLEKTLSEYNKIKRGTSLNLLVEDGFFTIPVIKNMKI